jgi:Putative F0F1-ATPase subunit (ATPase_gene1).
MSEDKNEKDKSPLAQAGPYLGLGVQLAATIVIMVFLGRWIDGKFNTGSLWTLICAFIGGGAGLYNFIKTVLDLEKKAKK